MMTNREFDLTMELPCRVTLELKPVFDDAGVYLHCQTVATRAYIASGAVEFVGERLTDEHFASMDSLFKDQACPTL